MEYVFRGQGHWALTSGKASLTAHVVYAPGTQPEELLEPLKAMLAKRFQVFHTTLQMEAKACAHTDDGCNFVGHTPGDNHVVRTS